MKKILWFLLFLLLVPSVQADADTEQHLSEMKPYFGNSENIYKKITTNGCYYYIYSVENSGNSMEDGEKILQESKILCTQNEIDALSGYNPEFGDSGDGGSMEGTRGSVLG